RSLAAALLVTSPDPSVRRGPTHPSANFRPPTYNLGRGLPTDRSLSKAERSVSARRITSLTGGLSSEGSPDPLECRHVLARTTTRSFPSRNAPAVGRAPATLQRLRRHRRCFLPVRGCLHSCLLLLDEQAPSTLARLRPGPAPFAARPPQPDR